MTVPARVLFLDDHLANLLFSETRNYAYKHVLIVIHLGSRTKQHDESLI
jgi:hypothetical protein